MGAAMSVTAFPVLARILNERDLLRTRVGALTIVCAAVDDVTAWCFLAVILTMIRSELNHLPLWQMLIGIAIYLAVMLFVLRPMARRLAARHQEAKLTDRVVAILLLCMLASSWATEGLGIHALFGAFLAGAIIPKDNGFAEDLRNKLRPLVVVFLVPLFFSLTGLRTSLGLINSGDMLFYCGLVFIVAIAGKFGGSTIAARVMGTPWRESAAIGILMNTRGLIQLVILNIGLDIGVLTPPLFSMMVMMAVGTTLMTTPVLAWVYPDSRAIMAGDDWDKIPLPLTSSKREIHRVEI
jgi:Kef-type K+ transport system membrane component KefB